MKTAEEMTDYCYENKTGTGFNKAWMKKHFQVIESHLSEGEEAQVAFIGLHNYKSTTSHDSNFAYAITNKRVMIGQKKLIGETFQTINLDNLNDITMNKGVLWGTLCFDTFKEMFSVGIDRQTIGNVHDLVNDYFMQVKFGRSDNSNVETPIKSDADELKKFKELLDEGIITEEEFNAKKKQLLNL